MSGVRSSFVVTETFGVSTSIVTSRNARQGARFRCVVLDDKRSTVFAFRVFGYKKKTVCAKRLKKTPPCPRGRHSHRQARFERNEERTRNTAALTKDHRVHGWER